MTTIDHDLGLFLPAALEADLGVTEVAVPAVDVAGLLAGSISANTARNYRQDWTRFVAWCTAQGYRALPAEAATVASYLQSHAEVRTDTGERRYAIATLTRWVAAIGFVHRAHAAIAQAGTDGGGGEGPAVAGAVGEPGRSELVRATLAALRRDYTKNRDRPTRRVAPLLLDDIARILTASRADAGTWTARVVERRDSALLLLGFAGALRRSELAALCIGDIAHKPGVGLHVRVASSKTDQDGHGHTKALTHGTSHLTCPPCAYRRWLDVLAAHHRHGRPGLIRLLSSPEPWEGHVCGTAGPRLDPGLPVFRPIRGHGRLGTDAITGAAIHKALRRNLTHAGYQPDDVATFGTHSARAGFVTQALLNGASPHAIMRQTGHSSPAMIEVYAREHAPSINNAVTSLGM